MILSMTGFAHTTCVITSELGITAQISFILKSVNARYFEATCKLPYGLQILEVELINLFRQQFIRGKIICTVHCSDQSVFQGPVEPSLATIKSYLQATQRVQQECNVPGQLTISDLVQIPDLFGNLENPLNEATKKIIMQSAHQACMQLTKTRQIEGDSLAQDIKQRAAIIEQNIEQIAGTAKANFELRRQKVMQELKTLDNVKDADLIRHQLQLDLQKTDINEELVRFTTHMTAMQSILESSEVEQGRRLDFLLQELVREINTIAAKSIDAQIGALNVNIKVELEKIREQAQNIV